MSAPATTLEHTGALVDGTTYAYRICALDAVGNMSSGATVTGKPVPETNPPTGTVAINEGRGNDEEHRGDADAEGGGRRRRCDPDVHQQHGDAA